MLWLPPHGHHGLHVSAVLDGSAASRLLDLHPQQHRHHRVLLSAGLSESAFCVLHDSAVAVDIFLIIALCAMCLPFCVFFATQSEHTSMTAATISMCFSYLHSHSRFCAGWATSTRSPVACSSWHHAFTILGSSRRPLGVLLHLFFLYLLVLGTTGFIVSVRSSHLCLRRIFGFITVRSSRLWLHHDSSDIINITLRSAQLYRRPSFNVVVIQRGDAR